MCETDSPILDLIRGKPISRQPVWLMRQAGRYLPEYRELRSKAKNFLDFCLTPDLAVEATLQPIRRFDMDAAILFADILLVPFGLGQMVTFKEGGGPFLDAPRNLADIERMAWDIERIDPVFETISRVRSSLSDQTTLIGFAGSPWTVACYMLDGQGRTGFERTRELARAADPIIDALFKKIISATIDYLIRQVDSGAQMLQLFESHAGLVPEGLFQRLVIEPTDEIVSAVKEKHPDIPIVGFPRGAQMKDYIRFADLTGVDVVGLDQQTSIKEALQKMSGVVLQGNLDPQLLVQGGEVMELAARNLSSKLDKKHIFNLGHGVLPETPPEHVAELVKLVHGA